MEFSFREWFSLFEGYSIDFKKVLEVIPHQELQDTFARLLGDEKKKWARVRFQHQLDLAQSKANIFAYSEKDYPHDFIEVEPVFNYTELPITRISPQETLPSFKDHKVWYGLTFRPATGFQNEFVDLTWSKRVQKLERFIKDQTSAYQRFLIRFHPLVSDIEEHGDAIDKELVKSGGSLDKAAESLRKRNIQITVDHLSDWVNFQSNDKLAKRRKKIREAEKELEVLKNKKPGIPDKDAAVAFLRAVQLSFLKAIKFPQTESSMELQDQIIDLAVNTFHRINPNKYYDFIVHPQSTSDFNVQVANSLAKLYNTKITRLNKVESPEINTYDLYQVYDRNKADIAKKRLQSQLGQQDDTTKKSVGKIQSGGKQFLGLWKKPNVRDTSYKNKHVLLVDDNTNTGATIQTMHHILRRLGPRKIDAFVPLYIKQHYASIS